MPRICSHCWHALDAALRANPALTHCPDCGAEIDDIPAAESATADPTPAAQAVPATDNDFTAADMPSPQDEVADAAVETVSEDNLPAEVGFEPADVEHTPLEEQIFEDEDTIVPAADLEPALQAIDAEADEAAERDNDEPLPELEAQSAEGVSESLAETAIAATPSFLATAATPIRPHTPRWYWVVLAVLVLLLGLQILLADRARLAADAGWRPLLSTVCGLFGCELPAWREPQAFAMLSRDVRPADAPGTLLVQATFRNDARWTQAWPVLHLSLSDADGRVVGARAFTAAEYLGKSAAQAGLAPGQSAQATLRLREPATPVVAFSFEFR